MGRIVFKSDDAEKVRDWFWAHGLENVGRLSWRQQDCSNTLLNPAVGYVEEHFDPEGNMVAVIITGDENFTRN